MAWSSSSEEPQATQLHEMKVAICAMQSSGTGEDYNERKELFRTLEMEREL